MLPIGMSWRQLLPVKPEQPSSPMIVRVVARATCQLLLPLFQYPFDRTQPGKLPKPQRAALRVEVGLPGVVTYLKTLTIPPAIPTRVITAGIPRWPKPEENQAWRLSHAHLAASVKDGKLLVAECSTHLIPDEQPEIIVATVDELVHIAKSG